MKAPQPAKPAKPAKAAKPVEGVEAGDQVYVQHPQRGIIAARVLSGGKDGMAVKCDRGEKHRLGWDTYLGHKARVGHQLEVVDQGADGAVMRDGTGRRRFVAGYQPPETPKPAPAPKKDDPLTGGLPLAKAMEPPVIDNRPIVFVKAIKNGPGLALRDVTDKAGHQTKRWMRTSPDQPGEGRRPGQGDEAPMKHGDVVAFRHGDVQGSGKIMGSGADGVTVQSEDGREHQVRHEHLQGPDAAANGADKGVAPGGERDAGAAEPQEAGKPSGGDGGGGDGPTPPDGFKATDYSKGHIDLTVTPEDVLKSFPPDTAEKMAAITAKLTDTPQTIDTFKKDGKYTPERAAPHAKIISEIMSDERVAAATPADGQAPTFTILGGRGGSGKSWFAGKVYDPSKAIVLDADEIKHKLPEYEGWNASTVHEESGDIFDAITELAKKEGLNIVHDATMKTGHKAVKLVQGFKDEGYRTEAHYMFLPPAEAAKRAVHRFLGPTQRFVPPGIVLSNTTNEASFDDVKKLVDSWSFRDNNVGKGEPPKLVSESAKNETDGRKSGRDGLPAPGKGDGNRSSSRDGSKIRSASGEGSGSQGGVLGKALADGCRVVFPKSASLSKAIPVSAIGDAAPTPAQIEAGNYRKERRSFQGLPITIENPVGSVRSGVSKGGKRWSTTMKHDYGYIRGTLGSDGDHYDCYVGPHEDASHAYIIDTMKPPAFTDPDEQKAMLGFASEGDAREAYLAHYDNPGFLGKIRPMPMEEFKAKVRETRAPGHEGMLKALGRRVLAFFKAQVPGGALGDLFTSKVEVKGHMQGGAYVAPHQATRHKRVDPPPVATAAPPVESDQDRRMRRLAALQNRPTRYEAIAENAAGEKRLVSYTARNSKEGLRAAVSERGKHVLAHMGAPDDASMTPVKGDRGHTHHVGEPGKHGRVYLSGRTQRDAIMSGQEHPYVGHVDLPLKPAEPLPFPQQSLDDSAAAQIASYEAAKKAADRERDLRDMWTEQGVSKEKQDQLIGNITAAAQPGAKVGPFTNGEITCIGNKRELAAIDAALRTYRAQSTQNMAPVVEGVRAAWDHRVLVLAAMDAPKEHINSDGEVLALSGYGRPFRISEDDPAVHGSHLLGYEGYLARFAYYRRG